jgi:hypothetical protein
LSILAVRLARFGYWCMPCKFSSELVLLAQRVEAEVLKTSKCGFESHGGHQYNTMEDASQVKKTAGTTIKELLEVRYHRNENGDPISIDYSYLTPREEALHRAYLVMKWRLDDWRARRARN